MTNPNNKTVTEYHANLLIQGPHGTSRCLITADTMENLKRQISLLSDGAPRYQDSENKGSTLIFKPEIFNGNSPFGWLESRDVPMGQGLEGSARQITDSASGGGAPRS